MQIIIDRFEGEFAVVELKDKTTVNMPRCLLPNNSFEGDVVNIQIDISETAKRVAKIKKLENSLFEN